MRMLRVAFVVAVLGSTIGLTAPQAGAATFTVNKTTDDNGACDPNDCSLREAILAANAASGADTIVLPSGYYKLSTDFSSLEITESVTITGAGAALTQVVGDEFGESGYGQRMLNITAAAQHVTLTGFTLRGGDSAADGAGILSAGGVLDVNSMHLLDNDAAGFSGGAVTHDTGTLNITSSVLSGNTANFGGAIFDSGGTVNVNSSTLSGNSAVVTGGAINKSGTLTLSLSTVSGNRAPSGGGIENAFGTLNVTSSTLSSNDATSSEGGAIHNIGTVNVNSSTLAANTANTSGGAIDNDASGNLNVTASTLSGNSAGSGGALANSGTANIRSSTITDNDANDSGGIINGGTATVTSSIVIGNTAFMFADCLAVASGGFNVFGASSAGCPTNNPNDTLGADPSFLGPLTNNGGPTETHSIAAGSAPVGNAGADPVCDGTTKDQRGVPRPDNACDSGAYQLAFCRTVVVNVVGTPGNDTLAGTHGPDGILALGGKDKVNGGDGNDAICGGPGGDKLSGATGNDTLDGGPGNDTCIGGPGNDKFKACEAARQ